MFGLFGIVNMVSPIAVASGICIDARAVIGVLSGAYGGPVSAVITATLMSIYRVTMGGSRITAGLCGIWAYAFIGYLYHRQKDRLSRLRLVQIMGVHFGLGVLVALVSFFTFLVLPLPQRDLVMQSATLPMLLIFPAAAALTGGFMFQQDRYADTMSSLTSERKMLNTDRAASPTTSSSKTRSCAFSSAILHTQELEVYRVRISSWEKQLPNVFHPNLLLILKRMTAVFLRASLFSGKNGKR